MHHSIICPYLDPAFHSISYRPSRAPFRIFFDSESTSATFIDTIWVTANEPFGQFKPLAFLGLSPSRLDLVKSQPLFERILRLAGEE